MPKYRIVTTEEGKYSAQVYRVDPYLGCAMWCAIGSRLSIEDAKDVIKKYKNAGKVVWEE